MAEIERTPSQAHGNPQLIAQDLDGPHDAGLAVCLLPIDVGTRDKTSVA